MRNFSTLFVTAIALLSQAQIGDARAVKTKIRYRRTGAKEISKRAIPVPAGTAVSNPFIEEPIENEPQWLGWDPEVEKDREDAAKVNRAFSDVPELVSAVYQYLFKEDNTPKDPLPVAYRRWFGNNDVAHVWSVYNNIANCGYENGNVECEYDEIIGGTTIVRDDWADECDDSASAYMRPESGHFTLCTRGLRKPGLFDADCDKLPTFMPAAQNLASIILHEFTHFDTVGTESGIGRATDDIVLTPFDCMGLDDSTKMFSAENYALLANEAFISLSCDGYAFGDPKDQ